MSQTESFRARREALVLRLRDQKKLTFKQIGDKFDLSDWRAAQIYQAAHRNIQFPPNGLSKRINSLLTKAGFTVEKQAIASALRAGKLYPHCYPPTYGRYAHRDLCEWAGVDPASITMTGSYYEHYPENGLSSISELKLFARFDFRAQKKKQKNRHLRQRYTRNSASLIPIIWPCQKFHPNCENIFRLATYRRKSLHPIFFTQFLKQAATHSASSLPRCTWLGCVL